MPAMLKTFVILASIAATIASNDCEEHDTDAVALLQSAVEEKRSSDIKMTDSELRDEYNIASPLKCKSEKQIATHADALDTAAPIKALVSETAPVPLDPPGAEELRAFLKLMCLVLLLDGVRRVCFKKDVISSSKLTSHVQMDEADVKRNWIELIRAANNGDEKSFKKVPEHPALLAQTDAWGCTALHFAAVGGSTTITSALMKQGAELDAVDADEETALHFAARTGQAPICELLITAGAKMNAINKQGFTPLVVAGQANQEDACRILADSGAGVAGLTDEELPPLVVSHVVRKVFAA